MYACEMSGCTAETTGCPFASADALKLTTSPRNLKYLHREFHVSTDRGSNYVLENYGMDGLNDLLEALALLKVRKAQKGPKA